MVRETIGDLTRRAAAAFGDRVAVRMPDGDPQSFRALDERVARFAGGLRAIGVVPGDRIVLHLANSVEWIVAYHAIARMGAVVVPANILLAPSEVAYIARDSGARTLICGRERSALLLGAFEPGEASPQLIILGGRGAGSFDEVAAGPPLEPHASKPQDLLAIAYTSGTTGAPKGAMTSHRAVHAAAAMTATIHVRHSGDRVLSALPLPHVYGNIVMQAALLAGYELILLRRFDAATAIDLIQNHRVTLFEGVPTMYHQLLREPSLDQADLSSLVRCTVGGQSMPTAALEEVARRLGCPVLELWGMTELAGPAASHSPYAPARYGTVGLPFPGTSARIVDVADGRPLAPGAAGELQVRGPLVTMGYWRNESATRAAILDGGWLTTGDIATEDADGFLRIVDRRKDLIITAGYNVYPAELENAIATHPAVAMSAVVGVPDPEKGEIASAFVVLRPGAACSRDDLIAHCRTRLAAYKIPRRITFVDDLPQTSTGKIMRRALSSS